MSTAQSKILESDQVTVRWHLLIAVGAALALAIGLASLSWTASIEALAAEVDYDFKDNNLAQSRTGLNKWMILGYGIFSLIGVIGLAIGERKKLFFFSFWILFPLAFWLWCGMTVLWSVEVGLSIRRIGHLYMAVFGAMGIAALLNRHEIIWMAILSMASLIALGIIAEMSLGTFRPWRSSYRFCGLGHPNETGLFSAIMCLAARAVTLTKAMPSSTGKLLTTRRVAMAVFLFGIGVIVITKSRTTLASLVVALFLVQLAASNTRNIALLVCGAITSISCVGFFLSIIRTSSFDAIFGVATIGRSSHVGSLTGRIPLWEEIFKWVERRPLFGHGYGGYWTTKRVEDFAQIFFWEPPNGHSIYVDAMVEIGFIGFALLVAALVATTLASVSTYLQQRDGTQLFVVGLMCLAIVHGLTESSFLKGSFGPLWLAIAIFVLMRTRDEKRVIERKSIVAISQPIRLGRVQEAQLNSPIA